MFTVIPRGLNPATIKSLTDNLDGLYLGLNFSSSESIAIGQDEQSLEPGCGFQILLGRLPHGLDERRPQERMKLPDLVDDRTSSFRVPGGHRQERLDAQFRLTARAGLPGYDLG